MLLNKSISLKDEEIKAVNELRRQERLEFETQGKAIKRYDWEVENLKGQCHN